VNLVRERKKEEGQKHGQKGTNRDRRWVTVSLITADPAAEPDNVLAPPSMNKKGKFSPSASQPCP
jgi:hypothetical protein